MRGVVGGNHDIRFGHPVLHQFGSLTWQVNGSTGHIDYDQQLLSVELTGKGIDVRISGVNQSPVAGGTTGLL